MSPERGNLALLPNDINMTTSLFASASLAPLSTLGVHDTSIACRTMIKAGIPKSVVAAHLLAQRGPGCVSLDYLEMRYGKMYGPRKTKK
jgi:hypothetical protein